MTSSYIVVNNNDGGFRRATDNGGILQNTANNGIAKQWAWCNLEKVLYF